ncbi:ATP-binding protein [Candidatus Gracilibacteria bacterium]|nr:ATP-binding protein [Candidatus Gracilibacteria bacterium]
MDRILKHQIKTKLAFLPQDKLDEMQDFFDDVLDMYQSFEDDRKLTDRSIEIGSQDLIKTNDVLTQKTGEMQIVLDNLLLAIKEFQVKKHKDITNMKVDDLSYYLSELISDSERDKKDIESQQKYLSAIVDSIGEGLMVVRSDRSVELFNSTAEELSGYLEQEVLDKSVDACIRFYDSRTQEEYRDFISEGLVTNKGEHIFENISLKSKSGNYIPVSIVTSPVQGRILKNGGSIIIFRDVTKQVEFDQMRDEFISIASHELRTPMTIINGYSGLLLEKESGEISNEQRVYVKKIKKNTQQLIQLVNDMLYVSKHEAGKVKLDMSNFSLGSLMHDICDEFQELFQKKGLHLNLQVCDRKVYSDAGKIRQILVNLICNAYKFTQSGGNVEIRCACAEDNVQIQVRDSGVGISEANIEKLFERFSQVHTTSHDEDEHGGTGLGLVICKLLTETLGGGIRVESSENTGSTFEFYFPIMLPKLK